MSHRCRSKHHGVQVAFCGETALDDGSTAAVGDPAGRAIKVSNIVPTAVKGGYGEKVYLGLRNEEDVRQGQLEPGCHTDLNGAHTNSLDGAATKPFNCQGRDGMERLEIASFR